MRTVETPAPSVGEVKELAKSGVRTAGRLGRGRWSVVTVVTVTLILYAIAWPTLPLTHDVSPPLLPLISGMAVFPFLLVLVRPALGWAVAAAAGLVIPIAFDLVPGYDYPWQVVHIMVMLALVFAVAIREEIRIVLVVWVSTVLLFAAFVPGSDGWGWGIGISALVVFGLLVRWLVISRRQLAQEEEASELERARRAILEEKAHIARDLHDIVAHHMSMIVVQAQSAPYRLPDVNDDVRAEFDALGATAREALNEVRTLLGVLRSDGQLPEREPQPDIDRIGELFESSRRAGMALETETVGVPVPVSDGVGLTVYRILQESLANAARHAPGARVCARLQWEPATVTVEVTNGPASPGEVDAALRQSDRSGGNGILGMVERASVVGGQLVAHPRPGGGFEVRAVLPVLTGA
ncbi:Signal transduction histidine kinase [Rhodococcus rhodochrous J3]|uniref:histidine kinase n=1 Tax=Rhodococcus rhodochrous J3 TaxID=903528 RepID=A0ABY1M748_RHORH|nr:Signal transduction histidine kinase [Rhodococcus rhodochrous J3]